MTSLSNILGANKWKSAWSEFLRLNGKTSLNPSQHGSKYESEAIEVYKAVTGNSVRTGCSTVTHPKYTFLNGQIDGLVTTPSGKQAVLEVKCPQPRNLNPMVFVVPHSYWLQMQAYMELYELDEAHYCEYYKIGDANVHFRWKTVRREKQWTRDILDIIQSTIELSESRKRSMSKNSEDEPPRKKQK